MASLSVAEQTFAGTGHLMATAQGQQRFPNVDVGAAVGSASYAPGAATFQGQGQTATFGTPGKNADAARTQALQAAQALRNSGISVAQGPSATSTNIQAATNGLRAGMTAPSSSHVDARNAPSGKGGQSR